MCRAGSLASIVADIGPSCGLEYRSHVRQQRPDREQVVYEYIWGDAARELGVTMVNEGGGTFRFDTADRTVRVTNLNTPIDGADVVERSLDKPAVSEHLHNLGIPTPVFAEFSAYRPSSAFRFLARHGGPCVVKPAGSSGGFGVTCGVSTSLDLVRAVLAAASFGPRLIIERQQPGDVYRMLFLDGRLLDVVRRRPSHITGDGRSTVMQLIAAENRRRVRAGGFAGLLLIRPDLDCALALRAAGLRPRSCVPAEFPVAVKTSNGDGGSADTETVTTPVSPSLIEEVAAAVRAVGAGLAGADVVAPRLDGDLETTRGAIIEVNVPPGLQYHYLVAEPANAVRVAVPILQRLLS